MFDKKNLDVFHLGTHGRMLVVLPGTSIGLSRSRGPQGRHGPLGYGHVSG